MGKCKHDFRTAYVQGSRPKRGFESKGSLCVKCWQFHPWDVCECGCGES